MWGRNPQPHCQDHSGHSFSNPLKNGVNPNISRSSRSYLIENKDVRKGGRNDSQGRVPPRDSFYHVCSKVSGRTTLGSNPWKNLKESIIQLTEITKEVMLFERDECFRHTSFSLIPCNWARRNGAAEKRSLFWRKSCRSIREVLSFQKSIETGVWPSKYSNTSQTTPQVYLRQYTSRWLSASDLDTQ